LVVLKPTKQAREKGAEMIIIGCDYHTGFRGWDYDEMQQLGSHAGEPEIAMVCSKSPPQ